MQMRRGTAMAAVAIAALLAMHGTAWAQTQEAYFAFTSDPGDYIGGGEQRSFTLDTATFQTQGSQDNNQVAITLLPFAGGFWHLHFAAPAGQILAPGVYPGATRWPFQSPGEPGLDVSGDGRGCNTLTGSFEVLDAVFGTAGYVERFHATFEQHCEGASPALRGEVRIVNAPPPAPLEISVTLNAGSVSRLTGEAVLSGTVTCSAPAAVNVFGLLRQRANRFSLASGDFSTMVACSPTATRWTAGVPTDTDVPFGSGMASADVTISGFDPNYGTFITHTITSVVRLKPGRD